MTVRAAGAALDPPLWTVVPNKARERERETCDLPKVSRLEVLTQGLKTVSRVRGHSEGPKGARRPRRRSSSEVPRSLLQCRQGRSRGRDCVRCVPCLCGDFVLIFVARL